VRLLFDQNISFRVANKLQNTFIGCSQVRELKLENRSDLEIWDYAKKNSCAIVTFDADFYDLVTLYGHPPKVIWLRIGNASSDNIVKVFHTHEVLIKDFLTGETYTEIGCLEIN
jgi:predicted nuclease of predicted toxin-antitoxin system